MNNEKEETELVISNLEPVLSEVEYFYIIEWYEGYTFFGYRSFEDAQRFEINKEAKEQLMLEQILIKEIEEENKELDLSFLLQDESTVLIHSKQDVNQQDSFIILSLVVLICIVILLLFIYKRRYYA